MTRRELILATVGDLVGDLLYYSRREDEDLPRGEIEAAVEAGEVTVDEMIDRFREKLEEHL